MALSAVLERIDADFDRHLERVRALLRQPSISASGEGIGETASLLVERLRALGAANAHAVETEGHPVVFGSIDAGRPRTLLMYGMYDVQPVAGEDWSSPPFAAEVRELSGLGRCIVNRGAQNQKGPLGGWLNALEAILAADGSLPCNLTFLIEGEEELASPHLPGVVAAYRDRLQADAVFFPHFSENLKGRPILYLGVKGIIYMELRSRGGDWGGPRRRMIHGSNAVWIGSPVWRLVRALGSLVGEDQGIRVEGFFDQTRGPTGEEEELLAALEGRFDPGAVLAANDAARFRYDARGVELLRRYLYDPTLNIDGIWGGYTDPGTKTVLPHEATAKLDVRLVPEMEVEATLERLRRHLQARGFGDLELEVLDAYPWAETSPNEPVVEALLQAMRDFDREPQVWPRLGGSAPFYLFTRELGSPFVFGGLGHGGRAHSPDEYCTVEGLRRFERSMAAFLYRFAGVPA